MKKSTQNNLMYGAAAAAAGALVFKALQKRNSVRVEEDVDMHSSEKIDQRESVYADENSAEKGLTQLDSAYREEWQANAFPQTHREMEELEKE